MIVGNFLQWLQDRGFAVAIREGDTLFPWIECVHVLAITLFAGSIIAVDLRLLDIASRERQFSRVNAEIIPIAWAAFAVAVISGTLLFSAKAVQYAANPSFEIKMALLLLAGVNMAIFQSIHFRLNAGWASGQPTPPYARLAGGISLFTWVAVIACGRTIGFTMTGMPS